MYFPKIIFILGVILFQHESLAYHCDVPDEWQFETSHSNKSFYPGTKWPGAVVKYELHSSLTSADKVEVQKAFDEYHRKTCIRFVQRSPGEAAYVSIENKDDVCGLAQVCKTGGYQFAQFGGNCRKANTMIHELGHSLCMRHEQSRPDRDNYVNFPGCSANDVPGKNENSDTLGSLYDYTSQMHYQCNWCPGGWPTRYGVSKCGSDVTPGLSVLDADKLNAFYDCGGCFQHRFRPIDQLTSEERKDMMQFGYSIEGNPLYICRAYTPDGAIGTGTYNGDICYVAYNGVELQFRSGAEVFIVPGSGRSDANAESIYKYVNSSTVLQSGKNNILQSNKVAMGREASGGIGYPAFATLYRNGVASRVIGKVWEKNLGLAYIPFYGKEEFVTTFDFLYC